MQVRQLGVENPRWNANQAHNKAMMAHTQAWEWVTFCRYTGMPEEMEDGNEIS